MFSTDGGDQVRLALLCDYALTSEDGKISAIGLFSSITFHSLPAAYPRFFVVVVAALAPGTHSGQVSILGPTGAEIIPEGPSMGIEVPEQSSETNLIIGFDSLTFESPGVHRLQLRLDGRVALTLPFGVVTASDSPNFSTVGNA